MKTVLNVKTDKDIKEEAQRIAKELGIPLSTVINAYLKEFIRDRELRLSAEPRLRPQVVQLLKKASKDYREGKNVVGPFKTMEELDAYLNL